MNLMSSLAGLFGDTPDASLAIWMSALAGVAAALAVALTLAVYFRMAYRTRRDVLRHGLAVLAAAALFAFVAYDMRHAALADRVASPLAGPVAPQDADTIRHRVL